MFGFDTLAVHGDTKGSYEGAVSFPIFQTSTYSGSEYSYSRCSNPTRSALERLIALLENGCCGFAFSSGLAAINALFSLLKSGDEVIVSDDLYGGTYRLISEIFSDFGIAFSFTDTSDTNAVIEKMTKRTKLIFVETPSNPMMKIAPIAALAEIAHKSSCLLAVDNTFLTPYYQNPLNLGADIVLHSATKYLSGHHDTICGLTAVKSPDIAERLSLIQRTVGSALSPFDCFLTLRGIQTLAPRMQKHQENACLCAEFLCDRPEVEQVFFAGLPFHPHYEQNKKQARGYGGVLSFTLKSEKNIHKTLRGGRIIRFAESLGGTGSLISYPIEQTHSSIPAEIREKIGITPRLLRLSLGLENIVDIQEDLDLMLKA